MDICFGNLHIYPIINKYGDLYQLEKSRPLGVVKFFGQYFSVCGDKLNEKY